MKIWKVVGIKRIQYTSKKTGREVSGIEFHLAREPESHEDYQGLEVKPQYVSTRCLDSSNYRPQLNDFVKFVYDERGNIHEVQPVNAAS